MKRIVFIISLIMSFNLLADNHITLVAEEFSSTMRNLNGYIISKMPNSQKVKFVLVSDFKPNKDYNYVIFVTHKDKITDKLMDMLDKQRELTEVSIIKMLKSKDSGFDIAKSNKDGIDAISMPTTKDKVMEIKSQITSYISKRMKNKRKI